MLSDLRIQKIANDVIHQLLMVVAVIHANIFACNGLVVPNNWLFKSRIVGYLQVSRRIRRLSNVIYGTMMLLSHILTLDDAAEKRLFWEFDLI